MVDSDHQQPAELWKPPRIGLNKHTLLQEIYGQQSSLPVSALTEKKRKLLLSAVALYFMMFIYVFFYAAVAMEIEKDWKGL